jgi:hypothetical protein
MSGVPDPRGDRGSSDRSGRLASGAAAALALAALVIAWRWGAFIAGGSDSYCYVAQAHMWLDGALFNPVSPGFPLTWENATLSIAPTGFVPSTVVPGAIAPICPPGLGLIMAAAEAAVRGGAFAIVPLSGALTVWCAFLLARRLAGPTAGLLSSAATLASPIVLYQIFQPMSDIPATACWIAALVLAGGGTSRSSAGAGLAVGAAGLIRPNLAPLAAIIGGLIVLGWHDAWRSRMSRGASFVGGALPGAAVLFGVNTMVYGSALGSGYGDPAFLFSFDHVSSNLARYPQWLVDTQTPWVLLGAVAPFVVPATSRRLAVACLAFAALLAAIYLPYVVFDAWWYLRFLLPGVVVLVALSASVTVCLARRLPRLVRTPLLLALTTALVVLGIRTARERAVFDLRASEARFTDAALWIREHVPVNAVVLAVWHSGSVRFYGDRFTVLWDALAPEQFDSIANQLEAAGRPPFLLLEAWEAPRFKERFGTTSRFGALDWPPKAQIGRDIALYDLADRGRYFTGGAVHSERVFTTAERAAFNRR